MVVPAVSPNSQQLTQVVSLVATGSDDVFVFQNPPTGLTWTGTLNCPGAPTGTVWSAVVGSTPWGEWGGTSVYGPVQALDNQQLIVTAQGLTAGVSYILSWIGSSDPSYLVQSVSPAANMSSLTSQIYGGAPGTILAPSPFSAGAAVNIPLGQIPGNIRTLIFAFNTPLANPCTNVLIANAAILYNQAPYLLTVGAVSNTYQVILPISANTPIAPGGLNMTFTVPGMGAGRGVVDVFGDSTQYEESEFYNGDLQSASVTATTTAVPQLLLAGPARLLYVEVTPSGGAVTVLQLNTITPAVATPLWSPGAAAATLTFQPNTIISTNQTLTIKNGSTVGTSTGIVAYASP